MKEVHNGLGTLIMTTLPSILVFGREPLLLSTRASILSNAGYNVKALSPGEKPPTSEVVDLLILCHTLTEAERNALLLFASSQRPAAETLCLTPTKGSLEGCTKLFNSHEGPAKLVETVQHLLRQ